MNKYYSLVKQENVANIDIYGDITSWEWYESDVSSYTLSRELESLDVDVINIYINSYGGEVGEGLAIYSALKRHKAKIKTFCDGFACSIASVIFMAGDERIMSNASLLMVHNAWTYTYGNANQLRKEADDLEKITTASINAYMASVNITEEKLKQLLDDESWILPKEALDMGFATSIVNDTTSNNPSQSIKNKMIEKLTKVAKAQVVEVKITDLPSVKELLEKIEAAIKPQKEDDPQQVQLTSFFNNFTKKGIK